MEHMHINALEDFNLVATHGGLGKASRASGRSKATLSRHISDLEEALGVRLIERGLRQLVLTEAGQQLVDRTEGPMHEVADALSAVSEGLTTPRGRLRIAAPTLFSQLALGRLAAQFLAAYPEVTLEVVSEDRMVDLVDERFDVAIRTNPLKDTTLVGRCFAKDRLVIAAAPSVSMPTGKSTRTIQAPAVVLSSYAGDLWPIDGTRLTIEPRPILRVSSLLMVRDAILSGAGVALLPQSIVWSLVAQGDLIQWGTAGREVELWVLHTSRRLPSPKVRAFVEFIVHQYPTGSFVLLG